MASDDLLQQLDTPIQKRLEENNKHIQQNIKAEVDPLHERLDAQREQISTVEKNLSGQISDVYDLVGDPIIPKLDKHDEQLTQHDADIAELQKAVGLRPKH
jgi:uncharacterized membrane-anchored protein YhcB (DUF1043 family)